MLFHKFLLREECFAVHLAFDPPLLRGTWNGRGWICTLTQEIEVYRGVTTLMQGEDYTEVGVINIRKITMKMLLSPKSANKRQRGVNRDKHNITPGKLALGSYLHRYLRN